MAGHKDQRFMIIFINDCRATAVNMENRSVSYTTAFDKHVSFTTSGESFNISPNSLCDIVERRGERGLQAWVEENKKDNPRARRLLNHSVRDVALAMGYYNWSFDDAKAALKAAGYELADNTINKRLRRGKKIEPKMREEDLKALLPAKLEKRGVKVTSQMVKKMAEEEDDDVWAKIKAAKPAAKSKPKNPTKDKKLVRRK